MQALQRNGSLNFAPTQALVVHNTNVDTLSGSGPQPQQLQINLRVSNAGININFSADNEVINSMLLNEPLSYVPITNFLSSNIMPTLATFGPWAHGYGLRPTNLNIQLVMTTADDGLLDVVATVTHSDDAGAYSSSTQFWSIDYSAPPNTQAPSATLTELSEDLDQTTGSLTNDMMASSDDVALTHFSEPVLGDSSVGVKQSKRSKSKAPVIVSQVHRSNRSNKYDGFKVSLITDSRPKTSKVRPRVTPNVASTVVITEISDEQAIEVPPPMSIPEIQQIGSHQCAIPPEELSEEVLLADLEDGPSNA